MSEGKRLKEATANDFDGFENGEYFDEAHSNPTLEMAELMRQYGGFERDTPAPCIDKAV